MSGQCCTSGHWSQEIRSHDAYSTPTALATMQYASELLSRRPNWYTNVGTAWLRHTCRHTASQRHHAAVGVTCALLSPVNSLFHVRGQTTETVVLPFTGQSCGTVFQPTSVC